MNRRTFNFEDNRDYLTFSEILIKFKENKYSEAEISNDYIELCKNINIPSKEMYKFLHDNLPTSKDYIMKNMPKISSDYFLWIFDDIEDGSNTIIPMIKSYIEKEYKIIPYNQIIHDLFKRSSFQDYKKLTTLYEELYNKEWFDVNEEIIICRVFNGETYYAINTFPYYIFNLEKKINKTILEKKKSEELIESETWLFNYKYKKICEIIKKRRGIKLDWNIKKILFSAIKNKNEKCSISKLCRDNINIISSMCFIEYPDQPITNKETRIVKNLDTLYKIL